MQHRPITLEYRLPSGETVEGYMGLCLVRHMRKITEAEDAIESESIQAAIKVIEQRNTRNRQTPIWIFKRGCRRTQFSSGEITLASLATHRHVA